MKLATLLIALCLAPVANATELLPDGLVSVPVADHSPSYLLLVDKEKRTLTVYHADAGNLTALASYPTDIGKGQGDKEKSGDARTPEGIYELTKELSGNQIDFSIYGSLAFTTNYPNFFDRKTGKTGHGIWLHAVPDSVPLTRGSKGCVVVRNNVIQELKSRITLDRTPLLISDQVTLAPPAELQTKRTRLTSFLKDWLQAWQEKKMNRYASFYASSFSGDGFKSLGGWIRHKSEMNQQHANFQVDITKPLILQSKNQILIQFHQKYAAQNYSDFGEKTLFVMQTESGYKIVGEFWKPLSAEKLGAEDWLNARVSAKSDAGASLTSRN